MRGLCAPFPQILQRSTPSNAPHPAHTYPASLQAGMSEAHLRDAEALCCLSSLRHTISPAHTPSTHCHTVLQAGMREAHLRDAEALCAFFAFLEDHIAAGNTLTEVQVSYGEAVEKLCGLISCTLPFMLS